MPSPFTMTFSLAMADAVTARSARYPERKSGFGCRRFGRSGAGRGQPRPCPAELEEVALATVWGLAQGCQPARFGQVSQSSELCGCEVSCGAPLGTSGHRKSMSLLSAASRIGLCLAFAISSRTRVCNVLLVIGAVLVPKNMARYLQGAGTSVGNVWAGASNHVQELDHHGVRQHPFRRPRRFALHTAFRLEKLS